MSGWLDGWVGGVVAAALTVLTTIWWDTRLRRRSVLDETVAALSADVWELGYLARQLETGVEPVEAAEISARVRSVFHQALTVEAYAGRSWFGPGRGFAETIAALSENLAGVSNDRWHETEATCISMRLACLEWVQKPSRYWRGHDRSREFLKPFAEGEPPDGEIAQ